MFSSNSGEPGREDDVRALESTTKAIPPSARASCRGVTVVAPWPMPTEITRGVPLLMEVLQLHWLEGMVPAASSGKSMPVFCESPTKVAYLAMVSMPSLSASE